MGLIWNECNRAILGILADILICFGIKIAVMQMGPPHLTLITISSNIKYIFKY